MGDLRASTQSCLSAVKGQARMKKRIVPYPCPPACLEMAPLRGVHGEAATEPAAAAARRFIMKKANLRIKERGPAMLGKPQTEVDIVKVDGQMNGIKSAGLFEFPSLHRKAGACHS